jgi:hypothetical protein
MLSHIVMRTALLGILGFAAMTTVVGCGPGLTRHSQQAKTPDVFMTMDAELKNSLSGTTTLTSAEPMPLPGSRLSLAQWEDDEQPQVVETWGVGALPKDLLPSPYVIEPGAAPEQTAEQPLPKIYDPASYP